jgi:hypothetical protein
LIDQNYAAERAYALSMVCSKKKLMNRICCFGLSLPWVTSPPFCILVVIRYGFCVAKRFQTRFVKERCGPGRPQT